MWTTEQFEFWLQRRPLTWASLRGQSLVGVDFLRFQRRAPGGVEILGIDLRGVDLTRADLSGVDLSGAQLQLCVLTEANLRGACLRGANLDGALLMWTDLRETDLRAASLRAAHLNRSELREARFDRWTNFPAAFDPKRRGMIDDSRIFASVPALLLTEGR